MNTGADEADTIKEDKNARPSVQEFEEDDDDVKEKKNRGHRPKQKAVNKGSALDPRLQRAFELSPPPAACSPRADERP